MELHCFIELLNQHNPVSSRAYIFPLKKVQKRLNARTKEQVKRVNFEKKVDTKRMCIVTQMKTTQYHYI